MWKIYYGDGSLYGERDGSPFDAPPRNVQVIVQSDPSAGFYLQTTRDYYVYMGDGWMGVDIFGLFDYLLDPGPRKVIFGRTLSNVEYKAIYERAKTDRDFLRKNALKSGERRP